ncbi:uncharacterized protein BX664DRAFT_331820 [Halteromyces radiatus]|uniref:uncharacterized protein n=1 Tax=Halteromyces radiatus TaxID=101107 RepID=UPI00221E89FC|nr:uncharacterized protein BX664DRAFT_331820 [Halteromyces radiatus]KAI8088960.1 hypothetical protein BX664DRAFT_331820 [Halteromyces radiatus]
MTEHTTCNGSHVVISNNLNDIEQQTEKELDQQPENEEVSIDFEETIESTIHSNTFNEQPSLKNNHDDDEEKEDDDLSDTNTIFARKQRRKLMIRRISYMIIMNAAIPIALYYILKQHIAAVWALVLSSTPTILSVIVQALFMRRVDSFGIAVIFGFILSVILASTNGDPKLLLLRESFVTAGVGIVCAITLIPIRIRNFVMKPVLYYLARDLIPLRPVEFQDPEKKSQERILFYWHHSSFFRTHLRILTAIDIVILELEFGLKLFYILQFELDTVVILSNSSLSAIGVLVFLFTLWYILWIRKYLRKDEPTMLKAADAIK